MSYQVTARKWRPMVFEDVVGQSHVTTTLRNAIAGGRVAHAYIFSGQRGCGKTTTARILAKALNCLSPREFNPDNTCDVCKEITDGRSLDVIEIDGASNRGVEEIRNLRESVRYTPTRGKYRIYIIDEVHMLTKEAFNALLKTLEEPPAHVIFVFATTEVHKVPATILSRCQRFDFRRISIDEITSRLRFIAKEESVTIDDDALMIIAKKGDGSLRDAQSIFDQIRSFCGNKISTEDARKTLNVVDLEVYFRITSLMREKNQRGGIEVVDEIIQSGYDLREFVGGLAEHFRNLLVVLSTGSTQLVETTDHYRTQYKEESVRWNEADLLRLTKAANDLEQSIRWASQPRYKLEAGLLQMIAMESSVHLRELLQQIDELKKRLEGSNSHSKSNESRDSSQTEVKVVGTVNAGPLRSAAGAVVARAAYTNPSSTLPRPDVTSHGPSRSEAPYLTANRDLQGASSAFTSISAEDAYARWQEWVGEVRKAKIGLASSLDHSRILSVANGAIQIACPDDYHASTLKRNREFLVESFRKVTGYQVHIEPTVRPSAMAQSELVGLTMPVGDPASSENTSTQLADVSTPEHPVITALIRELGAEKVE
ncbi:MAG: DNA polymerase III subunit gamma/tau [Ignavibacteriales bacterium]|nr:DNA polymerase III subunit gamma/tau [Ignavibacteriales bacterium]